MICDIMHVQQARSLAEYGSDFYAGTPVLSENDFGKGKAYYVATRSEEAFYADFLQKVLDECGVKPVAEAPAGVEVTLRQKGDTDFLFILNHNTEKACMTAGRDGRELLTDRSYRAEEVLELEPRGVMILACAR